MKTETSGGIRADALTAGGGLRHIFCSLLLLAAVVAVIGAIGSSGAVTGGGFHVSAAMTNKIAPWVTEHTADGQQAEFFVVWFASWWPDSIPWVVWALFNSLL